MSANANHPSTSPADMIAGMLTQTLGGAFDSIKDKITANITENGEEYLKQAVDRIQETTHSLVEWSKENPVKTTLAVAALAAVSTFLVHTMTASSSSTGAAPATPKSKSAGKGKAKPSRQ